MRQFYIIVFKTVTGLFGPITVYTHAQGTFPDPLESASNSFVCTRETSLLWTVFNKTSTDNNDNDDSRPRRPQLIRFPRDKACRSAAVSCAQ